ncbi:hypothetical protein BCV69DRAFT_288487 [Microstroma glucosiphilum]|uniref:Clathrin light chain n=1 Tax=Pseudomicrostroma glucosiphilum TaxID=1684307 RepID=A0A316U698_9BASI|nr:hypothetical protein BCV69DRAFT_288487 [Pseudomicrostroma glucosiphilum]PWN18485.1 hypothetical protein BCV69DRAFT_288487 [Pseudomicrostroma glucosiphilum]
MSFDFGSSNSNSNDPTSDFVSKFPDLDGEGGDAALTAAATGTGTAGGMSSTGGGAPGGWGEEDDMDLLGGGASSGSAPVGNEKPRDEREAFESSFPELDDPDLNGGGGSSAPIDAQPTVSASNTQVSGRGPSPSHFEASSTNRFTNQFDDEEEPEPMREWRHTQGDLIARRDAEGERRKAEAVSQAERDIDQFYKEYNAKKEKSIAKNKEVEAEFTEKRNRELAEGTTWDRITKLVELQNSQSKTIAPGGPGSTDLSRFRELLLSLRREGETAPAAGGY